MKIKHTGSVEMNNKKKVLFSCCSYFSFSFIYRVTQFYFYGECVYFRVYHHLRCTRYYYVIVYYCCWLIVKKLTWDWNVCGAINIICSCLMSFFVVDVFLKGLFLWIHV
jgi:hypothetical protein